MMISTMAVGSTPLPGWWLSFVTWLSHLGGWGWAAFVAVYVLASLGFMPGWTLKVAAGFAFGFVKGALLAWAGSVAAAAAAFMVSRRWARGAFERRFARSDLRQTVDRALGQKGAVIVLLLRLCPVLPASALNYLFGLTAIRPRTYLGASALGMLPGILLYVYLGDASRSELEEVMHHRWNLVRFGLWGVGLLAAVIVAVALRRRGARRWILSAGGEPGSRQSA